MLQIAHDAGVITWAISMWTGSPLLLRENGASAVSCRDGRHFVVCVVCECL